MSLNQGANGSVVAVRRDPTRSRSPCMRHTGEAPAASTAQGPTTTEQASSPPRRQYGAQGGSDAESSPEPVWHTARRLRYFVRRAERRERRGTSGDLTADHLEEIADDLTEFVRMRGRMNWMDSEWQEPVTYTPFHGFAGRLSDSQPGASFQGKPLKLPDDPLPQCYEVGNR